MSLQLKILDLLTESPALSLAEELTEPGALPAPGSCMVASRFPEDELVPEPYRPDTLHLDGIPNRTNGLPAGKLFPSGVAGGRVFVGSDRPGQRKLRGLAGIAPHHRVLRSGSSGWSDAEGYGPPPIGLHPMGLGGPSKSLSGR
jgi:hypothetical protein